MQEAFPKKLQLPLKKMQEVKIFNLILALCNINLKGRVMWWMKKGVF